MYGIAIECHEITCREKSIIINATGEIACCPCCGSAHIRTSNGLAEMVKRPKFRLFSNGQLRSPRLRDNQHRDGASPQYVEQDSMLQLAAWSKPRFSPLKEI